MTDPDALLLSRIAAKLEADPQPGLDQALDLHSNWSLYQGPCWRWVGTIVPAQRGITRTRHHHYVHAPRPAIQLNGRRLFVRRELRRILVHDGELPANHRVVQDGRCTDPRCVSVWHSGDKAYVPAWDEDIQLLAELCQILDQDKDLIPYKRDTYQDFSDPQLAQAAKVSPEIRKWMKQA